MIPEPETVNIPEKGDNPLGKTTKKPKSYKLTGPPEMTEKGLEYAIQKSDETNITSSMNRYRDARPKETEDDTHQIYHL